MTTLGFAHFSSVHIVSRFTKHFLMQIIKSAVFTKDWWSVKGRFALSISRADSPCSQQEQKPFYAGNLKPNEDICDHMVLTQRLGSI